MLDIKEQDHGLTFKVFVQPRSSKNEIKGLHGDAVKIRITAPPVDGAANKACLKFLAKYLDVPVSSLEVVAGTSSRTKHIRVEVDKGADFQKELDRIRKLLTSCEKKIVSS
jgi:hypothetical protein